MDDGPTTMAESLSLCRALAADGISAAIATPHQLGRYDGRNRNSQIRAAVCRLNEALAAERLPLEVWPGADVRLDERIGDLLARDEVMTLADGARYLLLELPSEALISPVGLARELARAGIEIVLTHPERNMYLCRNPQTVFPWLEERIFLQLTAASIVGGFGPAAEEACSYWLRSGIVSLVATDAHGTRARRPCMTAAFAAIFHRFGLPVARQVCIENPRRVLRGEEIVPFMATAHTEMRTWRRIARIA